LAVVGAEVFEDVLAGESGPLDTTLLWFVVSTFRWRSPASSR
jgi:hypothetical protein